MKSVATTASVAEADVSIVDKKDVTSRRRALLATAIDLETEVKVQDSTVNSVKNSISEETLMAALKVRLSCSEICPTDFCNVKPGGRTGERPRSRVNHCPPGHCANYHGTYPAILIEEKLLASRGPY